MAYEQTHNKPNRSAQVDEILDELSQYRINGKLWLKIVELLPIIAKHADSYEKVLAGKRKWKNGNGRLSTGGLPVSTGYLRRTPAYIREDTLKKERKRSKIDMPITFSPNQEWARGELSWDGAKAAEEAERFVGYCRAHGKKYADWDQAWRNWCRSPYQKGVNGNGRSKTEREQYGELLQSVRSDGLREFIAGRISDAQTGGQARNLDVDAGSLRQIPVRGSEEGGITERDSCGSSDLFANGGGGSGVAHAKKPDCAAGTVKTITTPFRRMD